MINKDFLKENWQGSYAELCRLYNSAYGTSYTRERIMQVCKEIGLQCESRFYTDEQKRWLKSNYPILGEKETAKQFEQIFHKSVSPKTLSRYCNRRCGCNGVSQERRKKRYDAMSSPVGTISVNARGEAKVKTPQGWIKATHENVNVPDGMIAFNLDGNILNNSAENIGITTNRRFRILRNFGMWSKNKDITKTGLVWVELYDILGRARK